MTKTIVALGIAGLAVTSASSKAVLAHNQTDWLVVSGSRDEALNLSLRLVPLTPEAACVVTGEFAFNSPNSASPELHRVELSVNGPWATVDRPFTPASRSREVVSVTFRIVKAEFSGPCDILGGWAVFTLQTGATRTLGALNGLTVLNARGTP